MSIFTRIDRQLLNQASEMNMNVKPKRYLGWSLVLGILITSAYARAQLAVQRVVTGLENPWAVAFMPDQRYLVTERAGRLRVVGADGRIGAPLSGLPVIAGGGQGGLLDVVTDSAFANNRVIYVCFAEPEVGGSANSTAVLRATLSEDSTRLENVRVIFSQRPKVASRAHFGCRRPRRDTGP